MKIAFAVYPEINLLDLFLLVEPLQQMKKAGIKPQGFKLDFCTLSELPSSVTSTLRIELMNPVLTPTLDAYDVVIVSGSQPDTKISSYAIQQWLNTIRSEAIILTTGNAGPLLAGNRKQSQPPVYQANNRFETLQLGIKLVELIAGRDAGQKVASLLGIPTGLLEKPFSSTRQASISRKTKETSIELELFLDGSGKHDISTGIPFFDHMLTQVAVHGLFDLAIKCKGDLQVDPHHTVEDVALALGKAFDQALSDRKGLVRMASATVPMDESLAQVSLDFSGRPYTVVNATWNDVKVGDLPVTLITHFLESFAAQARCNLSIRLLTGGDDHHRAEAIFKALARALDAATQLDPRRLNTIPSSKGVL